MKHTVSAIAALLLTSVSASLLLGAETGTANLPGRA